MRRDTKVITSYVMFNNNISQSGVKFSTSTDTSDYINKNKDISYGQVSKFE